MNTYGTILRSSLLAAVLSAAPAFAGPGGELDATFGRNGVARVDNGAWVDYASATAILQQPDGKLVIGASRGSGFAVLRVAADGSLDDTFGDHGMVTIGFTDGDDVAAALALQPDGKIVAVGAANIGEPPTQFALARLHPDGTLDPTFGGDGRVTLDLPGPRESISGIVLAEDGRLVVAGTTWLNGKPDVVFARFHTNGALDTTFGTGPVAGTTVVDTGLFDEPAALIRQPDGKYVACGASYVNGGVYVGQMLAIRLNADGSVDTSFGTNGFARIETAHLGSSAARDCVVLRDGTIVLAGYELEHDAWAPALARLRPDGVLDTASWNSGVSIPATGGMWNIRSIVALDDGGMAVTGFANLRAVPGGHVWDMYIAGIDADTGLLDPHFGDDGMTIIDFGVEDWSTVGAEGMALIRQTDGKLLAVARVGLMRAMIDGWDRLEGAVGLARVDPRSAGNAGFVGFADPIAYVGGRGEVTIGVRRSGGGTGPLSVDFATLPGSVSADAASGTLTWMSGDMEPKLITVQVRDYASSDPDKYLYVALSHASGTLAYAQTIVLIGGDGRLPSTSMPAPSVSPTATPSSGGGGAFGIEVWLLLAGVGLWAGAARRSSKLAREGRGEPARATRREPPWIDRVAGLLRRPSFRTGR